MGGSGPLGLRAHPGGRYERVPCDAFTNPLPLRALWHLGGLLVNSSGVFHRVNNSRTIHCWRVIPTAAQRDRGPMTRDVGIMSSIRRRDFLAALFLVGAARALDPAWVSAAPPPGVPTEQEGGTRGEPVAYSYDFSGAAKLFGLLRERAEGQLRLEMSDVSYTASLEVYRLLKARRHILYAHQISGTVQSERLLPGAARISWDFALAVLGVLPIRWHDEYALRFTPATDKVVVEIQRAGSDPTAMESPPDTVDLVTAVVQTYLDLKTGKPPKALSLVDRHGSPKRADVVAQGHMLRIDLGTEVFDFKTLELQWDETFRPTRLRMDAPLWSVDLEVVRS